MTDVIADDWYDEHGKIWAVCIEWASLHDIHPAELAGIFEWHGEGAWYPPDGPITKKAVFKWCAVNYGVYRYHTKPSEDDLYGWPIKEEDKS